MLRCFHGITIQWYESIDNIIKLDIRQWDHEDLLGNIFLYRNPPPINRTHLPIFTLWLSSMYLLETTTTSVVLRNYNLRTTYCKDIGIHFHIKTVRRREILNILILKKNAKIFGVLWCCNFSPIYQAALGLTLNT